MASKHVLSIGQCKEFYQYIFPFFVKGLEAHKYKNTLDCVMRIIRNEGLKA